MATEIPAISTGPPETDSNGTNRASADGQALGAELVLEARLSDDEDLLVLRQVEDLANVDGRGVSRAKDLLLQGATIRWDESQQVGLGSYDLTAWATERVRDDTASRRRSAKDTVSRRLLPLQLSKASLQSGRRMGKAKKGARQRGNTAGNGCAPRRP